MEQPAQAARALLAVAEVARTRYFDAGALLRVRPGAAADAYDALASLDSPVASALRALAGRPEPVADAALARAVSPPTARPRVLLAERRPHRHEHWPDVVLVRYELEGSVPELRRDDPVGQLVAELQVPSGKVEGTSWWSPYSSALPVADRLLAEWAGVALPRHRDLLEARAASLIAEDVDANRSSDGLDRILSAAGRRRRPAHMALARPAGGGAHREERDGGRLGHGRPGRGQRRRTPRRPPCWERCWPSSARSASPSRPGSPSGWLRWPRCPHWPPSASGRHWCPGWRTCPSCHGTPTRCSTSSIWPAPPPSRGVDDDVARKRLVAAASGASKRARTASRLLGVEPGDDRGRLAFAALDQLVARAERWAASAAGNSLK